MSLIVLLKLGLVEAACTFKGEEVCEGKIVKEIGKKLVKVCIEGKIKLKKRDKITPWPGYGGSCMWYGEVLCDGAVVQVGLQEFILHFTYGFPHAGPVPMVVSVQMLQVQDVCCEQILAGRHLG